MPRLKINPQQLTGVYAGVPPAEVTFTAISAASGNYAYLSGGEILLMRGLGALTIKSVADRLGRTGDISITLPTPDVGGIYACGPFPVEGFQQFDGGIWFDGVATVEIAWMTMLR